MDISNEQKARLDLLTENWTGDDDDEEAWEVLYNSDFVTPLQSPFELHYLANWWNWDDGKTNEVMRQILAHPLCDRGTALLLYWRSQTPLIESDLSVVSDYEKPDYELSALIEARLREDKFASEIIAYDPSEDADSPDTFKREVPAQWLEPSKGKAPEFGR